MRVKLTLTRAGLPAIDLAVTADATARVTDIAAALSAADPDRAAAASTQALTMRIRGVGGADRLLHPEANLLDSGLRAGSHIELVPVPAATAHAQDALGVVPAATLKVLSGPDAGKEFPLRAGANSLGRDRDVDVRLSDPLVSKHHARVNVGDVIEIIDQNSANGLVIGGEQVTRAVLRSVDAVVLGDTELCVVPLQRVTGLAPTTPTVEYVRSPRTVPRFPRRDVLAPTPPKVPARQRFPYLAIVAPIVMGVVLFAITQQLMSILFVALSPLLVIGAFVDGWFTSRRTLRAEEKQFDESMLATQKTLDDAHIEERVVRRLETPSVADAVEALTRMGPMVWSRRPEHDGFLTARLGAGTSRSRTTVKLPSSNDTLPKYWGQLEALAGAYEDITDVPITVDWRVAGALGLAGPREFVAPVARGILLQAIAMHSPAELVVTAFASPASTPDWAWLEWLPHTSSPHSPLAGEHLAANQGTGTALLTRIEALIESRLDEGVRPRGELDPDEPIEKEAPLTPSVIVVVENDALVDRGRLTRVAERGADANVHVVWIAPAPELLPAACRTTLVIDAVNSGAIVSEVRSGDRIMPIATEALETELAMYLARSLAPVIDVGSPVDDDSDLPRSISYAALAGKELLSESSAVVERWRENHSISRRDGSPPVRRKKESNLRALIGHAGVEPFFLDLKTQGPHALVGGTTGSGKSEFLQAWVLGIAAAHSPDRANFLLVDYKGGSAFAACADLPHTVGLVTDLSPHLVRRALTSLRAEIKFRERLLERKNVKDLATLEKSGDPEAPPSLLIIVDEFAALVSEVPEFVDGVVDVAQRGRSLGLHLILATQRPSGVIKDNLRANTNLRIALRMADTDDSMDILESQMAAHFDPSVPGRAAARTGPGRIATFQTGYTGGFTTDTPERPRIDITELGFGSAVAWDVPEEASVETGADANAEMTDITRIVEVISAASVEAGIPKPRKPWLDELAPIYDFIRLAAQRTDEHLLLGVVDDPLTQSQPNAFYTPDRDGNLAIFGTGGSGKSAALRSLAIASAVTPRGGPVQVYGLDFGAGGLAMLETLPHVGSIVQGDDDERVQRLLRMLRDMVDDRDRRWSAVNADSIADYRRLANAPDEPRILLLVDGIGAFNEAYDYSSSSAWFTVFAQIAAYGRKLGVHIAMTGDRPNSVPASINSTVQRRIVLRMATEEEYSLLGVPKDVLDATSPPGRGILDGNEIQLAILGGSANTVVQAHELERFRASVQRQGAAQVPSIGRLPADVPLDQLPPTVLGNPVIALADLDLKPVGLTPAGTLMLSGPPGSGRTTALATIAAALTRQNAAREVVLLTPRKSSLSRGGTWGQVADSPATALALATKLRTAIEANHADGSSLAILIEGITEFTGTEAEAELDQLIRAADRADILVVGESESSTWQNAWMLAAPFKAGRRGILLVPGDMDGDALLGTSLGRMKRSEFPPGRGFLVEQGHASRIQMARVQS